MPWQLFASNQAKSLCEIILPMVRKQMALWRNWTFCNQKFLASTFDSGNCPG